MDRLQMAKQIAAACLACTALPGVASEGIKIDMVAALWSGPNDKLRVNALWLAASAGPGRPGGSVAGAAPLAASVLGDYYFSPSEKPQLFGLGGFRASSALLIRQPGVSLSDLTLSSRSAATFGLSSHLQLDSVAGPLADTGFDQYSTLPYVGVGYSGIHAKSGWGFWADVGVVARSPGNAVGLGRVLSGTQSAEDLVRDLRLTPLVQLGVNYSF